MEQVQELLVQIAQCTRVYNYDKQRVGQKITVHQLVLDVIRLYDQLSSPVIFTVSARAVAINTILGFSALFDMLKGHFDHKDNRFLESLRAWGAYGDEDRAIRFPFWLDFDKLHQDALNWYGMDHNFFNISFNVLGVENGVPGDIARKNAKLEGWKRYAARIHSSAYDVIYEFDDGNEPLHTVHFPYGVHDPRDEGSSDESDGGSGHGPRRKDGYYSADASSSGPRHSQPPPKAGPPPPPQPKARPKPQPKELPRPKKPAHSNLSLISPPPPVMFSESSLSAIVC